jgi:hypothetical protein
MEKEEKQEETEVKRASKLTALIASEEEGFNGLQVTVYYSENNWETCEEVNLVLDENTTINQLIDSSIYKFKTELFYDNIDRKQFNVMLFKKKKKKPNDEYPLCNPESKVKDYGKDCFCLIEDKSNKKNEIKEEKKEEKIEEVKQDTNTGKNEKKNNNNDKDIKQGNINEENEEEVDNMYKTCSPKCVSCQIF